MKTRLDLSNYFLRLFQEGAQFSPSLRLVMFLFVFSQVEKTKHYLLLREKLESTLLSGQESLLSCVTEELSDSPQAPDLEQEEVGGGSEITTERQRELAAKVSHCYLVDFRIDMKEICRLENPENHLGKSYNDTHFNKHWVGLWKEVISSSTRRNWT